MKKGVSVAFPEHKLNDLHLLGFNFIPMLLMLSLMSAMIFLWALKSEVIRQKSSA